MPHAGFGVLLRWARERPTFVFTSNVDGQFQRAGFDPECVAEVHGSIHRLQCLADCGQPVWPADGVDVAVDPTTMRAAPPLPRCPRCGALARPNILMFGDTDWDFSDAGPRLAACMGFIRTRRRDLAVVEIGAGTALPTVRRQAEFASAATGALVRINVREPQVRDPRGVGIAAPAAEVLLALDGRNGS